MKITIWGKQYPLRLDTKDLHLSFPGIGTLERNKAKDSDLDYLTFQISGKNCKIQLNYGEYGLKVFPNDDDPTDLQFLFDNFDRANSFTLFFKDRSVVNASNRWTGNEMEIVK